MYVPDVVLIDSYCLQEISKLARLKDTNDSMYSREKCIAVKLLGTLETFVCPGQVKTKSAQIVIEMGTANGSDGWISTTHAPNTSRT